MKWFILGWALFLAPSLFAANLTPGLSPAEAARYQALIAELRCLVCQNQSLHDSDASLAGDLRREVLQLMQSGQTDAEIVAFLVARYGDFVLYRPPLKLATVLLWVGPFGLLLLGLIVVGLQVYRRSAPAAVVPDAGQLAKLRAVAREVNPL